MKKDQKKISKELLEKVEQVGFIRKRKNLPYLEMMGNELCINATLAFASTLNKRGKLFASGVKEPIGYINKNKKTSICFSIAYKKTGNIVVLKGIGFIFIGKKERITISKRKISALSKKYDLPAFGLILCQKNKIYPYIYVKSTNSFVKESACGSGSIALCILKGYKKIIQPTKQPININIKKGKVIVTARVKEVK